MSPSPAAAAAFRTPAGRVALIALAALLALLGTGVGAGTAAYPAGGETRAPAPASAPADATGQPEETDGGASVPGRARTSVRVPRSLAVAGQMPDGSRADLRGRAPAPLLPYAVRCVVLRC
ncbi:hypothetical protein [Streptomyces jumonjinensis]|uniref:Uncharacterized protein n=1 Tax=Streptomyces jumonjinensis TaxID=1945 RepID=A0A646KGX6_STRJU|nr:hypothetical protein [Streptomyces jumonjinensis]MQT01474.1 hypothetical protein [Streptomyces jumonjinensis]